MASRLGLIVAVLLLAAPAHAQSTKWWRTPDAQRILDLRPEQIRAIDEAFEHGRDHRLKLRDDFDHASQKLEAAMAKVDAPESALISLSEQVERIRMQRNIERTRVLLDIYWLLTPDQRSRLDDVDAPADLVNLRSSNPR